MQKIRLIIAFLLIGFVAFAQDFPEKSNKLINDFTNTLDAQQIQQLEKKLIAFEDSTSNQIAVVMIKSVGGYDINDYALQLGRKWGIGGKDKNNGVILLIALNDRKMSIQTGYGLEGALPDIYTKRIIQNNIKPYFKQQAYFEGIDAGTDAIISLIKGEYKNDAPKTKNKKSKGGAFLILILIVVAVIFFIKKGGRGGNGGQVIGSRGVTDALLLGMLFNGMGRGSGGGFGGGGDSGGSFGGFGGGSFGGGGSSGDW
ncbi:MAG: TPM domain-containing protein [Sphingobacteriaceae bacterium]|nr:TPM domain-containing protein [Sphingobacteriaceae bacterium]